MLTPSTPPAPSRRASQPRVALGVALALALTALPFFNKTVRSREAAVAAMRDASYAKDEARNARLSVKQGGRGGALDLGHGARLLYLPAAIPDADGAILRALETEVEWLQRDVTVWGRTVPQRRLVAYQARPLAQPYSYSGLALPPTPWTPAVAAIKAAVEAAAGCAFDTCLLNLYRDGTDAMAWHADGDALYGPPPTTIASASFGAGRAFQLRPTPAGVADGSPAIPASRIELTLGGGDVLLMQGTTQRDWQHAVPPRARVGGVRVNLTFRATAAFKELQRLEAGAP